MGNSINVKVQLFGVFRTFVANPELNLELSSGATITDLRSSLKQVLKESSSAFEEKLLDASAIGSEQRLLGDSDIVSAGDCFAVLPPVCGG